MVDDGVEPSHGMHVVHDGPRQAPPVKRSAIAAWFTPVGGIVPTAVQLLADTQDTPFRASARCHVPEVLAMWE